MKIADTYFCDLVIREDLSIKRLTKKENLHSLKPPCGNAGRSLGTRLLVVASTGDGGRRATLRSREGVYTRVSPPRLYPSPSPHRVQTFLLVKHTGRRS